MNYFFSSRFIVEKQIKRKIINKIIQLTLCLFFISLFFLFTVVQFDWMFLLILNMFNCFGVFILFFSMKMLCCFERNIFICSHIYFYNCQIVVFVSMENVFLWRFMRLHYSWDTVNVLKKFCFSSFFVVFFRTIHL